MSPGKDTTVMGCVEIAGEITGARPPRKVKPNGYALLVVMFFVALVVISVGAAAPSIITEGRREKEKEMVWRGKQYVRGIRLFYQKTQRFPTQLEDLYKPKTGIRFMRQAYKDPMNSVDGSWRLICVGPGGQLIGSLKEHSNAFFFGAAVPAGFGGALASPATAPPSASSPVSNMTPFGSQNSPNSASNAPETPNSSGNQNAQSQDPVNAMSAPQSVAEPLDDRPTLGQTIIVGVGGKISKASILRFEGAKNYLQFEFIWNGSNGGSRIPSP